MIKGKITTALIIIFLGGVVFHSCKHEPIDPINKPGENNNNNNSGKENYCDPDTIYFERDLLPLFISNCAISGCHDAGTAEDGVILDNYNNIFSTGDVKPGKPWDSEIYEKIMEADSEEKMPPPPANALSSDQKEMIRKWIQQGAKNLTCKDTLSCDTTNVSFAGTIRPIINMKCLGCHSGGSPSAGISLEGHANISQVASSGKLTKVIQHAAGVPAMPQGGNKLPDCEISQIVAWINGGMPNN